jgi:hypothetical protein
VFLDADELVELTRRRRSDAQMRVVQTMGIEHRRRSDGTVVVLRSHIEDLLGGAGPRLKPGADIEPDWSTLKRDATRPSA